MMSASTTPARAATGVSPAAPSGPYSFTGDELPVAPAARRAMQGNKRRDTKPELALRGRLHARGFRYRVDHPLPFDRRRRADLVFSRVDLYVFVDGCFWHRCPLHYIAPKTRADFWRLKIDRNVERDAETDKALIGVGATPLRIWEHVAADVAAATVARVYSELRRTG